jgi:two-component system, cell cycle sensor histidine kinase PleC
MRQAPERATYGPLQEDLADCDSAALLIHVGGGAVLDANSAGWKLLGVETQRGPLPLDCAMPAVQTLRGLSAGTGAHDVSLTFWTPGGRSLRATCAVSTPGGQGALRMVRVLAAEAERQSENVAKRADGSSPQPLRDVALRSKLAHELRTPLGAVIAYAEILKDEHFGPMASDRYKSYARNIHESARHAMAVLEGMLKGEEEASGMPQLTFADIDPARIVEACLLVAEPLAEKAGLALSAEVPPNLPRVVADAVSLRQMLLNLLANAIKFARRGDRVKVTVAYDADGPLRISVVDTGPGMEHADHAAGKGVPRQERPRSANAGLGLGLPLTRSLATANGAVLAIDSALGRGTCATISFGKDRLVPV